MVSNIFIGLNPSYLLEKVSILQTRCPANFTCPYPVIMKGTLKYGAGKLAHATPFLSRERQVNLLRTNAR